MKYKLNHEPEEIDPYYNKEYTHTMIEDFDRDVNVNPFVYKVIGKDNFKRLVIIWTESITNKSGLIISNFKLELDYEIKLELRDRNSLSDLQTLLLESCITFSDYYTEWSRWHHVRLRDIEDNYDTKYDLEAIFLLLYGNGVNQDT